MTNYIFTPNGFYIDGEDIESREALYEKLYHMGFEERPKEERSRLLEAVPYAIGAEHITNKWIS